VEGKLILALLFLTRNAEVKNGWSYTYKCPMYLYVLDRDNFIFATNFRRVELLN